MRIGYKIISSFLLFVAVVGSGSVFFYQNWRSPHLDAASSVARPALKAVLDEYLLSKVSGAYWENEMLRQEKFVAELSLQDRLNFYREILLACDLETSRALLFSEMVGKDAGALHQDLITLRGSYRYSTLSNVQRKRLLDWLTQTEILAHVNLDK